MRYFLQIAYHGTTFHGWQIQKNTSQTIQGLIQEGLSKILREPIQIVGSGRTDTGVHCKKQFAHVDLPENTDIAHLHYRINRFLPPQIAVDSFLPVREDAHARFDALLRTYHYHITYRKDPFSLSQTSFLSKQLDMEKMNQAASLILNHTDFESFSKVKTEVNNFECQIKEAFWEQSELDKDRWVFVVSANRFLRGMVRAIVGTLFLVGQDKMSLKEFEDVILAKNRRLAGAAASSQGLFLVDVQYPNEIFLLNEF